ncbi:TetR/AcrR family transcriptional regulator [Nguyenibacter vanlangensis]|uniref:TetR/AcrR family transcriptional regulator n=2 Tax=Nguyenibacter vanlangensis TaxID=1216886 RepID=A0A7Y7IUF3_9PROT|nr:TetR/AcrR family transcriptional regulator [Nguyenibacter vanlangensis]
MTQDIRAGNRGRPRVFDEAEFLNGAIALFSASGFSGVGISELTKATGLTVGSVYKAYQDKEGVFVKALEHYIALREAHIATIFEQAENARARIEGLLRLYVDLSKGRDGRLGCLIVAGIADIDQVGQAADILRAQISSRQTMLSRLIEEGQRDGSIAAKGDACAIATVLLALLQGMRVVGKAGEFTEDGEIFVARALRILD